MFGLHQELRQMCYCCCHQPADRTFFGCSQKHTLPYGLNNARFSQFFATICYCISSRTAVVSSGNDQEISSSRFCFQLLHPLFLNLSGGLFTCFFPVFSSIMVLHRFSGFYSFRLIHKENSLYINQIICRCCILPRTESTTVFRFLLSLPFNDGSAFVHFSVSLQA